MYLWFLKYLNVLHYRHNKFYAINILPQYKYTEVHGFNVGKL